MLSRLPRCSAALLAATLALAATLLLAGCGGASHARTGSSATHPGGWSTLNLARRFGPGANAVAVSCTSGAFCMVLGANSAYTSWKTVTYAHGTVGSASPLTAGAGAVLACASPSACLSYSPAEGTQTDSVWNGQRWTEHRLALTGEPSGASLTCPSPRHCLAIGDNGSSGAASLLTFTAGAGAVHRFANHGQTLSSITCASAERCYVVSAAGEVWTVTGAGRVISGPTQLTVADQAGARDPINEIACTAGPYCVGVGTGGGVVTNSGDGFRPLAGVTLQGGVGLAGFSGSCGSASFCLVETPSGSGYAILDGSRLTPISRPPAETSGAFSCSADRLCMADLATSSATVVLYTG